MCCGRGAARLRGVDAYNILGSEVADDSFCSMASLNESIKRPVKGLRNICSRITRSSTRRAEKERDRDREGTPECSYAPPQPMDSGFKTPKAPKQRSSATPKNSKRLFGPVSGQLRYQRHLIHTDIENDIVIESWLSVLLQSSSTAI
ncbi:GL20963 [Drosophila persimilis]|uniref:GL20963 n=1 Tax=Drosophila persimilis TaxID=7234 RepID=B4HDQ0_DROPE|nr:GL20963 [Drosophila persimilis]